MKRSGDLVLVLASSLALTGEKAFVATMGQTPAALDAAFAAWVKAL